ncbi:5'-nucleotidase, lipoprotein e(P4) family [Staphylococcus muscae]|uniref:5'-nucleotidase, lipoprotein e(P4) family n=1 Tax=Staphylococcus muscae TaxID=1294 RepID=A0A240BYZ1_9STAP|nr:5'-nucleotidase, lipoprotein e(P4) family [Staphylococcus muscae]AVQ34507.1 5'-nucleotidase, lipoprotein e(P4) family [Staphylococcus muscae]PNZ02890.1 5'-nucleotidase, lipoprotein e(P4) family [Staphylococcus muscae]GGA91089.1 5'-nucleotidase, lipoprotein e(P4) family [Staphylococcus muscae]SNW01081.1 acid phosphatase 5'-nucleotidase, lipoprotein e(P4) family [Staphylococcus muscae]
MNQWTKTSAVLLALGLVTTSVPHDAQAGSDVAVQQQQMTEEDATAQLASQNMMGVAWYQNSAEAKALYAQGYNSAKEALDEQIKKHKGGKKLAIALDIDETVLDNSPYQAYNTLQGASFPDGWHEWVQSAQAKPVYGAKDFLKYADEHDVEIFYVSDRSHEEDLQATIKNLKQQGLPQSDEAHVLLKKEGEHGKTERRDRIKTEYRLVQLFGDNLLDFDEPKVATLEGRETFVKQHEDDFGSRYIIFPNPMYGSWEATLYNNDYSISAEQKSELRQSSITYFDPETQQLKQGAVK